MDLGNNCRVLTAVSIDPESEARSDNLVASIVLAFGNYAGPSDEELSDIEPMTVMVFRQNNAPLSYNIGDVQVFNLDADVLDKMIHVYENGGSAIIPEDTTGFVLLFGLGDNKFCQAFVHFVSTMQDGLAQNWGMHYVRRLAGLKFGDTLWYDSLKPNEYFFDELSQIIRSFSDVIAET